MSASAWAFGSPEECEPIDPTERALRLCAESLVLAADAMFRPLEAAVRQFEEAGGSLEELARELGVADE